MNSLGKAVVQSKTIIFNVIMMLILVAESVPPIWESFGGLPTWVMPASATVVVFGNIALRVWFTDTPITSFLRKG